MSLVPEAWDVPVCVDADEIPRAPSDRGAIVVGGVVAAVFFGGLGLWAAFAPLSSAAVAPGELRVDSHRKTVSHMEGGIVRSILVRDGDEVQQGQALIQLDDTQAMSNLTALQGQEYALLAAQARLAAERDNLPAIQFPLALERACADERFEAICIGQENIFADRKKNLDGRISVLNEQIDQFHSEINGRQAQQDALEKQINIVGDETKRIKPLVDQNLLPQPRLLALQQQEAQLEGNRGEGMAEIAKAGQEIDATQIEIANALSQNRTDIANELRSTQDQLIGVEEKLRAAADVERRTTIVAPQSGKVVDLRYFTPGGVVKAGEPILDIVPQQDELIVEASVRPIDIEAVHKGLAAQVRLVAVPNRNSPTVKGVVTEVSADTLENKLTGQSYYTAEVAIPPQELSRLKDVKLFPGMPVDVLIVTGRRTLLNYLLDPLRSSFSRAFREN
ncbi:MAG TPA: HlyD family type I secretion periplasmic adaptor subunit [Stellaceae bacterium]|nr:HlyD family type I secretion periplasmic adaptor subunit [Stellaceae bacterium]